MWTFIKAGSLHCIWQFRAAPLIMSGLNFLETPSLPGMFMCKGQNTMAELSDFVFAPISSPPWELPG